MLILLCNILRDQQWAEDTCALRLSDERITFNSMHGKLAAILTDKLSKGTVMDTVVSRTTDKTDYHGMNSQLLDSSKMALPTHYGSKVAGERYESRGSKYRGFKKFKAGSPRRPKREATQNDLCFRCNKPGHWSVDCKDSKRMTMTDAIAARLHGTDNRQAAEVRFQFASDFDRSYERRVL